MLVLVRHGETGHNAARRLLGRLDVPLDPLGRRQAEALGRLEVLRDAKRVVSSPLGRALATAEALGPPVTVDERWVELDYGIYDGAPLDAVPDLWAKWCADPLWAPEGGESLGQMSERVESACEELWGEAAVEDVVVVSHVSPIKAAVAWVLGLPVPEAAWRMFLDVASITRIGPGRGGAPTLRSYNDTQNRPSRL